jgi:hypothetical protein
VWIAPEFRDFLLDDFRSLDDALDEHPGERARPGDPVYGKIFDQLAADVTIAGFGRDDIGQVAFQVGQSSTFNRLRSLMAKQLGQDEQEAITHLQGQIDALAEIRGNAEQARAGSAQFIGWKSHTTDLLGHFIPANSEHQRKFRSLQFRSNVMLPDYPGVRHSGPRRDDIEKFASDAEVAIACLQGAIQYIKTIGLKQPEPAARARPARSDSHPGKGTPFRSVSVFAALG